MHSMEVLWFSLVYIFWHSIAWKYFFAFSGVLSIYWIVSFRSISNPPLYSPFTALGPCIYLYWFVGIFGDTSFFSHVSYSIHMSGISISFLLIYSSIATWFTYHDLMLNDMQVMVLVNNLVFCFFVFDISLCGGWG